MDDTEITAYFIKHLSDSNNPNDLILDICEKTGKSWTEVEAFLEHVRAEHDLEISRRQTPLLTLLAMVTFIAGVGIFIYSIYFLIIVFQTLSAISLSPLDLMDIIQSLFSSAYMSVGVLVLGLGMSLGSLMGMRRVWVNLLSR